LIVTRYKRPPAHVTVCYLRPDGVPISEHGRELSLEHWPEHHRLWASADTVRALVQEGRGESLCWKNQDVRWHAGRDAGEWQRAPSDALVIWYPLEQFGEPAILRGLARWRDWLEREGAGATGTLGSCSWSLLRATLEETLFTPKRGDPPPISYTLGGRQETGPPGPGLYEGSLEHVDLQAAYARELGRLEYGGRWRASGELGVGLAPARFGREERPLFVRAKVRIPELATGPLPDRPRSPEHPFLKLGLGPEYPTGVTIQRVWSWQELVAAERAGVKVLRLVEFWAHIAGDRRPFAPWLEAVERGRRLNGLAGQLAKMTGNALVGRFSMRGGAGQWRTIRSRYGAQTAHRLTGGAFTIPAAHDLAETVTGRTRARVFAALHELGNDAVAFHTDGGWRFSGEPLTGEGWRVKSRAERIELLGPQTLRYWSVGSLEPQVVFAGLPATFAPAAFDRAWAEFRDEHSRRSA
jgi:hypothetical protein